MQNPKPGIYKHYKGNLYEVCGTAVHTETEEELVIYRSLYGSYRFNARPKSMFLEEINVPELVYRGPRFALVQEF